MSNPIQLGPSPFNSSQQCKKMLFSSELENVKSFTRTNQSTNQILPREKRVNHDNFGTSNLKTELVGFLVMNNYQLMAVCPLILNFLHMSSQKCFFLLICLASQTFYPYWPIFLHGYIRHIRDIFQRKVFIIISEEIPENKVRKSYWHKLTFVVDFPIVFIAYVQLN